MNEEKFSRPMQAALVIFWLFYGVTALVVLALVSFVVAAGALRCASC